VNQDPTRTCAILVDLPDIVVLGTERDGSMLSVHIETKAAMTGCPGCGVVARVKERVRVSYCDLPVYGVASTLVWHKRRFVCRDVDCDTKTWSEVDDRIAAPRMTLTDRAGRFATKAVGQAGRSVNEVAERLGCDWHTVNAAVLAYGTALIEHPERFDDVTALGLDETAFVRLAPYFRTNFITSIVDVGQGQLLDIVPGRGGQGTADWLQSQSTE
jgi:transposase